MAFSTSKTLRLSRTVPTIPKFAPPLAFFSKSERCIQSPSPPPAPPQLPPFKDATMELHTQEERGRWSKFLLFIPGAITFGLGTWQIFRRQEKIAMLDYRKGRLNMEPIIWNEFESLGSSTETLEFRKVICEGEFDEGKSLYVGPRSRSISGATENGYYIVSPFIPNAGKSGSVQPTILVNRGWVPRAWRNGSLKDIGASENPPSESERRNVQQIDRSNSILRRFWPQNPKLLKDTKNTKIYIKVVGVVCGSEKPSIFVPENDPKNGQWFYVDIPMIAHACGLPDAALYIEYVNESDSRRAPYPVPKDANTFISYTVMPQDHLHYTLTWYSLSAAITFMAFKRIKQKIVQRPHF